MSSKQMIPILFLVVLPLFILGRSAPQGHVNGLILFSLLGASLLMPDLWLRLIGLIISSWLAYAYAVSLVKPFPITSFVNTSLGILLGIGLFLFIFRSTLSIAFYSGAICISALLQALLAICQKVWFDPVSMTISHLVLVTGELDFSTPVGTLANPNFLGAYLAISIPFFFRKKWAWLLPIVAYGLYITHARAACGAVILGTGYYLFGWKGFVAAIIPGLAYLMTVSYSMANLLGNDRYLLWIDAAQKVCASVPSFLVGFGQGTAWMPHNLLHSEYVMTLFNYGAIGLFCMIAYIVTLYRGHKILFTAFLILCINMMANHPLHIAPTAILAIVIIGLLEREKNVAALELKEDSL